MREIFQLNSKYIYTSYKNKKGLPKIWSKPKPAPVLKDLTDLIKFIYKNSLRFYKWFNKPKIIRIKKWQIVIGIMLLSLIPQPTKIIYADPLISPAKIVMLKTLPEASFKAVQAASYIVSQPTPSPINLYAPGNCTWGVASWVSIPQDLGNANTWASRATAEGYMVSSVPLVGSVAETTAGSLGHVALVTSVGDGTVTVKEMNYEGLGLIDSRITPISDWVYIYF